MNATLPRRALALLVVLGLLGAPRAPAEADDAGRIENELANVEARLAQVQREFASPVAETLTYPLERRLIDAHVFFEQGLYAKASVLLTDIVENPRFAGARDIPAATYLLGRALFLDRNYQAAARAFERLVANPGSPYAQDALAHLVEIALARRDATAVAKWVHAIEALPTAVRKPDTLFVMGKALFQTDEYGPALAALGAVPPDAPRYLAARYYMGAILVALARVGEAEGVFHDIVSAPEASTREPEVVELAHMALGRMHAEEGRYAQAIDQYQFVGYHSRSYETALNEMAWAYVNAGKYREAANTLDILILNVHDERLEVEASVLRGRLDVMLGDHEGAGDAYQRVVDRFSRVRAELDEFLKQRESINAFFRWLLYREDDTFALGAPLSERVTRWLIAGRDMQDIEQVLADLARARLDLRDAQEMAEQLRVALDSENRVELFSNLRSGWTRLLEIENGLIDLERRMLDARTEVFREGACGADFDRLQSERRALEEKFRGMPQTVDEYVARQDAVHRQYSELRRQAFLVETSLKLLARQTLAVQSWVRGGAFEEDAPVDERARAWLARIDTERRALEALREQLGTAVRDIEVAEAAVGAGDTAQQGEKSLKRRLLESHRASEQALAACEARVGSALSGRYPASHERVWRGLTESAGLADRIADTARRKADDVRRLVVAEERDLGRFEGALSESESRALTLAGAMGRSVFAAAQARIDEVVLEADLGLVDLAWARKQRLTDQVRELRDQQAAELVRLEDMKKAVLGSGEEPAPDEAPAPPPAPDGE